MADFFFKVLDWNGHLQGRSGSLLVENQGTPVLIAWATVFLPIATPRSIARIMPPTPIRVVAKTDPESNL